MKQPQKSPNAQKFLLPKQQEILFGVLCAFCGSLLLLARLVMPPGMDSLPIERPIDSKVQTVRDWRTTGSYSRTHMATRQAFSGILLAVQPRVFLQRASRSTQVVYKGYLMRIVGQSVGSSRVMRVGISEADQQRHALQAGDRVEGEGKVVRDRSTEVAQLHRVEGLRVVARASGRAKKPPPWLGVPEPLPAYRECGFRELDQRTFEARCVSCVWACEMAVELTVDSGNRSRLDWRTETFCYGPASCGLYHAGSSSTV